MVTNIQSGMGLSQEWGAILESALVFLGISPWDFLRKSQCLLQCLSSWWVLNSVLGLFNKEKLHMIPVCFSGAFCLVSEFGRYLKRKTEREFPQSSAGSSHPSKVFYLDLQSPTPQTRIGGCPQGKSRGNITPHVSVVFPFHNFGLQSLHNFQGFSDTFLRANFFFIQLA